MAAARISKRKLKEDNFIAATLKAWEYIRDNEKRFFIGLVAVVCIAAVVGWGAYARKQSGVKASSYFADAIASFRMGDLKASQEMFSLISKEHGGTEEGIYASYFLGKCLLETGKYPEAIEAFDRYLSKSGRHPFFRDAAMEGKALSLENEHRYKDAGDAYLELSKNLKMNHFMEAGYLRSAAENFRSANETQKAIEVLGILLEKAKGTERRDIEIEMEILRG